MSVCAVWSTTGLTIFDGDAAKARLAPGLVCAPGDGVADAALCSALGRFWHIEKFIARSKGRIANRNIIKRGNALSADAQKTSAFSIRRSKHGRGSGA